MFIPCLISKVLRTLTHSFSGDTIDALAIIFSVLHLTSHDYAYVNNEAEVYSGTFSLNAAMFSAIILASRLDDMDMVVLFILLAIICFSWFPELASLVKMKSFKMHLILISIQWFGVSLLLFQFDTTLFTIFELFVMLLIVIGPVCYLHMLRYKRSWNGPWDIVDVE
jgi:phosphatidylinositol glycan class C protein